MYAFEAGFISNENPHIKLHQVLFCKGAACKQVCSLHNDVHTCEQLCYHCIQAYELSKQSIAICNSHDDIMKKMMKNKTPIFLTSNH